MKAILFILIFLFSASLYSAEPMVKFYNVDGSAKEYKLNDIDSLSVTDQKNNYVLRIHYDDTLVAYYPIEIIGSIKFKKDSLNVYIFGFPKPYKLSSIDSLIFYIDQWQPLTIGSQVWMLKNLNVDHYRNGDSIPEVRNANAWLYLKTGAWCNYNRSDSLGKIYGKLYNWYTVDDTRCLAPDGWHISTDSEWTELENYLGGFSGKMKSTGTIEEGTGLWVEPNRGATNSSGFSALPGGERLDDGFFQGIGGMGNWWTATESDSEWSWNRGLISFSEEIERSEFTKLIGLSVRCIKDTK